MAIDFNADPYYDNYNETDQFYRIMFKPGYAVQTRELNQLQSIIQKQIEVTGKWLFKDGSMVLGGESSIDCKASYVTFPLGTLTDGFIGSTITGATSGVTALVLLGTPAADTDLPTLFVKYTNSGTDTQTKTFADGELITDQNSNQIGTTSASLATGYGSIASINSGFYFVKNVFTYVQAQTIALDKYSSTPSFKVGLDTSETFINSDDNHTLLDNAQGSFNYAAPGADRYGIDLKLTTKNLDGSSDETNFVQLKVINNGIIIRSVDVSSNAVLEQTLARRTYDESGDYTVTPFLVDIREYRNNFRDAWTAYEYYLAGDIVTSGGNFYRCRKDGQANNTAPTVTIGSHTISQTGIIWTYEAYPFYNRGINNVILGESLITQNANAAQLNIGLEPGKAYVHGYEITKTAIEYISIPKARDTLQQTNITIPATVGNYIVVTNLNSLPDVTTFPTVSLYNQLTASVGVAAGTLIGTARIRYIEFNNDTDQALQTTNYKVSLFDITMVSGYTFMRDVKQLFIAGGGASTSFSADISSILTPLNGSITAASTAITGVGTLFSTDFKVGDYISVNISNVEYRRRVTVITSNTVLTIASAFGATVTGEKYTRVQISIYEAENESLLYPLTYPYAKTIRDNANNNVTRYTASQRFVKSSVIAESNSTITITVSGTDSFASAADIDNYLVLDDSSGLIVKPLSIVGGTTQEVVITMDPADVRQYVIIAAINRSGLTTEKTKTLTTSSPVTFATKATATKPVITLGKADGFRLLQVLMDTGTFDAPSADYSTDITSRYVFNDGQTISSYGLSSISLLTGETAPVAPIKVIFEYFAHSGTGDHFSVNSYLASISYDEIPLFGGVPLSFFLDFRPSINDAGTGFSETTLMPKRGIDIVTDFQHYLSRKDKIILNQNGSFFAINGTPALIASEVPTSSTGMIISNLNISPYNYSTGSVKIDTVDNKRYTMRDIGKLESRIDNIEYYTSLSMLEQSAQSLQIQDSTGLNRFKNGFVVDNFTGNNIGDITSPDYRCAIDMENGILRPSYYMDNVNLIELNTSDSERATAGYQVTGDLITLPYTEVELAKQLNSSRVENINPFAIFTFIGNAELNPPSDEWFETKKLPDINLTVAGDFDTVYATTLASGALSGVWNAWQTQWTGAPITTTATFSTDTRGLGNVDSRFASATTSVADFNTRFGTAGGGGPHRVVTAELSTTTSAQSRTGIRSTVVPRVDKTTTGDVVLSKAVIPYIRARSLLFVVSGLKPNTRFTPFFDSVDVSSFTIPASELTISRSTQFDASARSGGDSSEDGRLIDGNSDSSLDRGDLVFLQNRGGTIYDHASSPVTGVLSLVTNPLNGTTTTLHIVNVKGTFLAGDIVEGSISGALGTIQTSGVLVNTIGNNLVTNNSGEISGIFNIPNTDANRFRTGTREFKLSDDLVDNIINRTSYVRKQYVAEGILSTTQATITSTRNADVRTEAMNDYRTVAQDSYRVVSDTGWYDPLAQTFLVDSTGGAFVTSIDVFFASRDTAIPVRMQIREVVNGFPGKTIVPFSETVLSPEKVNISTTFVNTVLGDSYPAPIATNFKFVSPVYLNDKTEYAIVLISDSNNYKLWISQLGDVSVVDGGIISEQPYAGVLFKSQNGSTWTADQSQDLMFNINKAKFDVGNYGEADFINNAIPTLLLRKNPIFTVAGTNYVRVTHENHGMFNDSKVILSGAGADIGGIPFAEFNAEFTIVSAEIDSYIIHVSSNATFTGSFGGDTIVATENIQYNTVQPIVSQYLFPDTDASYLIRTTTGKSVDGTETPYSVSDTYNPIAINQNNILSELALIGTTAVESDKMSGAKSVILRSRLISYNENVSPAVDVSRLSLITVQDIINNPIETDMNYPAIDTRSIVSAVTTVAVTETNKFSTSDTNTKALFLTTSPGKYLVTIGFASPSNNGKFLITEVAIDGSYIKVNSTLSNVSSGATVTINILDRFVDEIAPLGGSSIAKYVSKKINLQQQLGQNTTFLKVRFTADVEQAANIDMYYKLQQSNSSIDFETLIYTKAIPTTAAIISNDGTFTDVEYEIPDLPEFNAVQVKLVLNSTWGADIIRVKDLVIVGCA